MTIGHNKEQGTCHRRDRSERDGADAFRKTVRFSVIRANYRGNDNEDGKTEANA